MKKVLFFLMTLMALSLAWGGAVKAQTTGCAAIGEESTSYGAGGFSGAGYMPIDIYYKYSYEQMVYDGSEMPTTITSISFKYKSSYALTQKGNVDIYLGEATSATLSSWLSADELTLVYSGALDFPASSTGDWVEFTFNQNGGSFSHDQSKFIVVVVNDKSYNYPSSIYSSMYFCYQECENGVHMYLRNDNNEYSVPPTSVASNASQCPIVRFCGTFPAVSCEKPSTLEVPSVTTAGATLTWTGGSGTYNLEVKGGSYADWTPFLSNTTLTTTTLTPLDPETQYQVRVQSVCGEEVSGWKTTSFTTPCGILSTFPKTYTFETSDGFPSNASTPTTNQLGNCWRNEATVQSGSNPTRVWGTSTSYKKNGSQSLTLPDKGNSTNFAKTMLAFPAMNFTSANGYVVSFWIYRSGSSTSPEGFKVYASDCDTIGASAVELGHYSRNYNIAYPQTESASGWYYYETSPIMMTGTVYIIFEGQSYFGSATYVDDVTIKVAPNCLKPTGLEANNVTTHSADLSWTVNSGETAWTLYYKKTSDENYTEVSNVTENPYTLPSLDHSSNYQFYVVANCSATDNSEASDVKTFSTECAAISADGYSANFDDYPISSAYTPSSRTLPLCWKPINECTYSSYMNYPSIYYYSSTDYSNSSPNSLRFYSYYSSTYDYDPQPQYAILPEMTDLTGKRITLQARGYNTSSTFKVGTMSDPTDVSTFTEITSSPDNPAAMTTSYQKYIFDIANTTDRYVAIMIEAANSTRTYNGVYIDDIVFSLSPTCYAPTEAHADVQDANNATISWTSDARNTDGGSYSILDADQNVVAGAENITGTSFPLIGLTPETSYTYYVHTNCFNTAENVDDVLVSFTTPASCAAPVLAADAITDITAHNATVTWTGFTSNDEYAVRYRTAAYFDGVFEEFSGTSLPTGWAQYSAVLDNVLSGTASLSSGSSWYNSSYGLGSYNWKINIWNTINAWMVTPSVTVPANGSLSFDVALTDYNSDNAPNSSKMPDANSRFVVLVSNDNMTTWTSLREWNNTGSSYVLNNISNTANAFTIDLSAYEGGDVKVAFYVQSSSGPDCDLHIDNVTIGQAIPAGDWQTVTPNPTTVSTTLTGLTAETPYEVKVNGVCGDSEEETGSVIRSFTTTIACPAPTNLAYSNVAAHTADLTWNVNGNPTTNYVLTKNGEESNIVVTINEGVASYALTELNGETEYTVSVHANCGTEDGSSMESNEVTFTTQVSCAIPTGLEAVSKTTSSIKLHWTANNNESAWVVAHKIDGATEYTEVTVAQSDLDGDGNYNLTGLADGKTYTIKVRANCGETDGLSQWSSEITHATEASCATPTDLTVSDVNGHGATISWSDAPVEGKNYIVMVASENMPLNVDFENNSIPSNFTNDANYPWYVYTGTDCTSKAMRSGNFNISSTASAIEVTVNVTEASTLSFDFWSRGEGTDNYDWDNGRFYIDGAMIFRYGKHDSWESYSAPIEAGTHTLKWEYKKDNVTDEDGDCFYVDNIKITTGASAFVEKQAITATSLELDDLDPETTYYVKVKGDCGSATSPESDVETFTTPAACNAPTSLTYDDESVTAHTVDLSWTENNGATAWKVIYNDGNTTETVDVQENDVTVDGTTITYPLGGLTGATTYSVRVKSNCGGVHNDISAESNSTSFTTLTACYPVGDVITSDITAYTVTVHWSDYYNAGAYIVKQGDNVLDGTTTPSVVIDATNHTATISGLEPEHTYTYGTFTVFADCGTEGMSTGTKVPSFQTEPSCHPVTNVNITGKTANSVTFTWEDTHTPEAYVIKEGEDVLTDVTAHSVVIDATNLTATISGLDENETYSAGTFKVFADCGTTDGQSAGVNVPAFTTPCSANTIFPWTETFNDLTTANTIPDCWNNDEGTTSNASYNWCYTTATSGNGACNGTSHDGSKCVRFNSYNPSSGVYNCLKSIPLSLPTDQAMQLKFWYKNPAGGDFSVYISTDGGATHETALATGLTGVSDWTEHDPINLSAYAGQEVVLVFKGISNCGYNDAYIYLDDVTVEEALACPAPTGLYTASVTSDGATVRWAAGGDETAWNIQYHAQGENSWTTGNAQGDSTYTFSQLTPNTTYEWQVQAVCGDNNISDWSVPEFFTTEAIPEYTVTFVAGNSGTCNTTELTGITVELPTATPLEECANNGWTFAGWSTSELTENTTTAPAPLYEAGTNYTPSASVSLYAVYMRTEGEATAASYNLVTEAPNDWSGEYLIAYTTTKVVFNSSQDNLDANNAIDVNQYWDGNTIASNATTDAQKVTIAATGNGNYSLLAANGKYFGNTSTSNDLVSRTSPAINNTINLDASGNAVIESNSTYLRLNTGSGSGRFRYYGSGQQPIQLYRYTSATPVMYAGAPDCFIPVTYNVTVTQVQGATITATPSTAAAGDVIQLSIDLDEGYALNQWQVTASTGPVTVNNNSFEMPAANVNVTATLFNVYTVAATAVPANGGTVNGAGSYSNSYNEGEEITLTAAANTGYDFTGWYNGDDQVSPNSSYTFTVAGNVNLEARFAERHTVTFNPGTNGTCATQSIEGSTIDLSNVVAVPSDLCVDQGWTFAGWSETSVDETTTAPTLVNTIYSPASDIDLYAVYKKTDAGAGQDTWTMATSIAVGDVVVMAYEGTVKKELTGVSGNIGTATDYTTLPAGTYPLTVEQGYADNSYAFKNNSNYLALTGSNNNLYTLTEKDNRSSWTVTSVSDGFDIKNVSYDTRYLQYNTSSPRFACYTHTQKPVRFYKLIPGDVTTYNSNPNCINSYVITAEANDATYGTVTGTVVEEGDFVSGAEYAENTGITLTAIANTGYTFVNWTKGGELVSLTPTCTLTVTEDAAYVANFVVNSYNITVNISPSVGGTVTGADSYVYGSTATLTATANTGYHFVNWTKDDVQVSTDAEYSFTVTGDATYVANFELNNYDITVSANPTEGGTVSGDGNFNYGDNVILTAIANTGYHFVNWTKGGESVSTNPTCTLAVTGAAAYVANFELNSYDITVSANPTAGGTVSGGDTYNHGATVTLTATANEGYTFTNWTKSGEEVSTESTYSFAAEAAGDYVANFTLNSYEITATANPAAGGTVTGAGTYSHGANVTLTAMANEGYTFTNWTKSGEEVSTQSTYSFAAAAAGDYVANFTLNSYDITVSADPTEGGNVSGAGTYNHGADVTLTATANEGYTFVNWTKGGESVSTNPTCTLAVTGAAAYVAHFSLNSYAVTATVNPAEGGSVTGAGTYSHGANVTLTAIANNGYHFVNWTENDAEVSTDASYSFTFTGARNLVANFAITPAGLSWSAQDFTGYTMIDFNNWKPTVNNPNNVSLRYGCVEGNNIDQGGIMVDATTGVIGMAAAYGHIHSTSGTFHIYAVHETDETAYYDSIVYTLNVLPSAMVLLTKNIDEGGSVSMPDATDVPTLTHHYTTLAGTPTAFVAQGQDLNVLAENATGYHFTGWTLSNEPLATTADYTYHVPDAITGTSVLITDIKAVFDTNTYTLTVLSDDVIMGSANGSTTAKHFLSYEISATPNTGYHFTQWSDGNTQNPRTVTLTENTTYTAEFAVNSYAITTGVLPANSGSVTGAGTYNHFDNATLTATATTGYTFTNWTENGVVVNATNPYEFQVTGERELVANFSLNTYAVSASANPAAGGTVTGAGTYDHGTNVTVTATANDGYAFVNWTEGGQEVSTNASYTFTFTGARTLVANFTPIIYTVTFNPGTGTCQTQSLTGSIESSIDIDAVTAVPSTICGNQDWVFAGWSTASVGETSQAPAFVSGTEYVPTGNIDLYAVYKKTVDGEPTSSTASIDFSEQGYTNGETVSSASIGNNITVNFFKGTNNNAPKYYTTGAAIRCYGGNYFTVSTDNGTPITNIALTFGSGEDNNTISTDNGDYSNGTWTGNENSVKFTISGTSNHRRIAGISVTTSVPTTSAIYNSNPLCYVYAVNVDQNIEHGSVVADQTTDIVAGTEITLTPTPATGYHFGSWIVTAGNDPVTVENNKFTMPESNVNVSALFWIDTLTVNVNANPAVGGTVAGAGDYEYGDLVTLIATANTGYTFVNWTENNQEVSTDATYEFTFNGAAGTRTFVANFSLNSYEITVSANPTAGGTVNGGNTYNHGATAMLTATPSTGYHFVNWTKDGDVVSTDANYSFTVAEAGAYVANFALNSYTIAATANPTAGGTVNGAGTYNHFDNVTLTATVVNGYDFDGWYNGNDQVATSLEYSFVATGDVTLEARFAKRYTITFVPGSHSSSTIEPLQGSSVTAVNIDAVTADPSTLCVAQDWVFAGWSAASVDETTQAPAFVSGTEYVPTDNITLYAVYSKTEGVGSSTASIDFTDQGYTNAQDVTDVAISNNVNVTFSKGTSNNAPKYYSNNVAIPAIRCYGGNTFTVTATEASITNITLTFGTGDGNNYISPDDGDYSNGTWTGNENSVTFTIGGTSGNRRIAGMSVTTFSGTVTYNSDPECFVYDVVVNPDIEHGTVTANPNTGVIAGTEITLTNTPSEGYHFAGWTVTAGNDPVTVENNKFLMPESDVNVTATFEPDTFTLTINYSIVGGGDAPQSYSDRLPFGTPYSVNTPVIAGLTPSQEVVSGTMPAQDVTVNVTYSTVPYTLTIHYVYADNTPAANDVVRNLAYNVPYSETSPTIEGYTPDQAVVSGTMGEADVEVTVVYSINSHNLTINYVNEDASAQVAESHTATLNYHDNYSVTSPQVAGYAANKSVVSGTMGDADKTETVAYYQVQTSIVDATNCAGTGTGSLTVTAPTGNFEYSLDGVTFQTQTLFANLNAGDYTLYIRPTGEDYNYSGVWTVNSNITMPVAEASVNPFYCLGDEINLSGNGSSTGSEYTYAWSGPNNFTATDINATIAAAEDIHSGSYTLTVTNTVTNCVSDTTVDVIVNTPNMNGYLFTIATHGDAYANLVGGQATPVFATPTVQHYLADAGCTVNVNNDAQATYEEAGDYTITWTATDACGNTATTTQVLHIVLGTCPVAADVDGNTYPVVALNNICWMAANLRTTHYSDGRLIPNPMVYTSVMYPDATANLDMFGYLYDWTAAMDAANGLVQDANGNVQGICPDGWRMPKENEIRALVNDGVSDIFDLRTTDQWLNNFGTNTTGFSLLPAGCYNANSDRFENLHGDAYIWGVGASAPAQPRVFWADCKCYNWQILDTTTPMGYSVRCVRNN